MNYYLLVTVSRKFFQIWLKNQGFFSQSWPRLLMQPLFEEKMFKILFCLCYATLLFYIFIILLLLKQHAIVFSHSDFLLN